MIPLVYFTSSEKIMGKRFKNNKLVAGLGWGCTIILTLLNIELIIETCAQFF
jgi:manganese transport protein